MNKKIYKSNDERSEEMLKNERAILIEAHSAAETESKR
jgi:hypothetical protein